MKVVHVARKPLTSSVAESVLEHGTGALNIDATRIGTEVRFNGPASTNRVATMGRPNHSGSGWREDHEGERVTGRWPSNLILQHLPGCRVVGSQSAPGYKINRWSDGAKPFGDGAGHPYESQQAGGGEEAVWDCAPGCPAADLDVQSGVSKSSGGRAYQNTNDMYSGGWGHKGTGVAVDPGYGDVGGASRYFKQVGGSPTGDPT